MRTCDDHIVRDPRVILKRAAYIKRSGVALMTSEAPMGLLMSSHQPRGWKDGLARPACELWLAGSSMRAELELARKGGAANLAVSYTHLTLPTIYSV